MSSKFSLLALKYNFLSPWTAQAIPGTSCRSLGLAPGNLGPGNPRVCPGLLSHCPGQQVNLGTNRTLVFILAQYFVQPRHDADSLHYHMTQ